MIRKTDEKSFFPAQLKVQTLIPPGRPQTFAPVAGSWQGRDPRLRELSRYLQKGQESPQTEVLSSSAASLSARAGTVPHLRLASPTCLPAWASSPPGLPAGRDRSLGKPSRRARSGLPQGGGLDILRAVTGSTRAHELRSPWSRGHRARPLLAARLWLVLGPRLEETLVGQQPARAQTSVQMPPRKHPP